MYRICKCVFCLSLFPDDNAMTTSKLNSLSYLQTEKSCRLLDHERTVRTTTQGQHRSIFREENVEEFVPGGYPAIPDK